MTGDTGVTNEQFELFLSDPILTQAIELSRRVDDIFDIIGPLENQHSTILEWLFDPREGHGHGQAIFKDFLAALHKINGEAEELYQQRLFTYWTRERIAIADFQSVIVIRERSVLSVGRQDLFILDPVHRFLIVIENKAGTDWTEEQLEKYRDAAQTLASPGGMYEGYQTGFVLLEFGMPDFTATDIEEYQYWTNISYVWIQEAAQRAEEQSKDGKKKGHQLVAAYCRRLAKYDPRELTELLARIARDHTKVVRSVNQCRGMKPPAAKAFSIAEPTTSVWVWVQQHKYLASKLKRQKPLSFVIHELIDLPAGTTPLFKMPKSALHIVDETWLALMGFSPIGNPDCKWPVSLQVSCVVSHLKSGQPKSPEASTRYKITVKFRQLALAAGLEAKVRSALAPHYGEHLCRHIGAKERSIGQWEVSKDEISEVLCRHYGCLHDALSPIAEEIQRNRANSSQPMRGGEFATA